MLCTLKSVPRQARIDLPGQLYHVIVRGVARSAIFRADTDRLDFIKRLADGFAVSPLTTLNRGKGVDPALLRLTRIAC